MRAALLVLAVAGAACGGSSGECSDTTNSGDCGGGDVCARNGECLPASQVRLVRVTWTINGQPANDATCAQSQDLYLLFYGFDPGDSFGFQPVPCKAGLFTIDKIPTRFGSVEIGDSSGRLKQEKVITAQGTVAFDLVP